MSTIYPAAPAPERFDVAAIEAAVHGFYDRVRADATLGPIFDARISDWGPHLDRMVLFWRSVLRREPGFKPSRQGPPPLLHRRIEQLDLAHYERWLALWREAVTARFAPDLAEYVYACACRIADVFSAGLRAPEAGSDEAPPRSRWYAVR